MKNNQSLSQEDRYDSSRRKANHFHNRTQGANHASVPSSQSNRQTKQALTKGEIKNTLEDIQKVEVGKKSFKEILARYLILDTATDMFDHTYDYGGTSPSKFAMDEHISHYDELKKLHDAMSEEEKEISRCCGISSGALHAHKHDYNTFIGGAEKANTLIAMYNKENNQDIPLINIKEKVQRYIRTLAQGLQEEVVYKNSDSDTYGRNPLKILNFITYLGDEKDPDIIILKGLVEERIKDNANYNTEMEIGGRCVNEDSRRVDIDEIPTNINEKMHQIMGEGIQWRREQE